MSELDARIVELETRLAFQEDSIEALSNTVAEQQQTIEKLTIMIKHVNQQLKSLPQEIGSDTGSEPPPPHY